MSFSEDIKNELCRSQIVKSCCASAECLGMLLYCNRFSADKIKLVSASHEVRKRAQILFNALFGCQLTEDGRDEALMIDDPDIIKAIFDWFGFRPVGSSLSLNRAFIEEECCKASFLRGCFLMGGYASDGHRGYHLELVTSHYSVSNQVATLLDELSMTPGAVVRRGNNVLYYKNSRLIEDFLTYIGAPNSAMDIMLRKIERSFANRINRDVNCETANFDKVVGAAGRQIAAIERIEKAGRFDDLPSELRDTALLRKNNPMASLAELAALHEPPVSKPGLSSRFKRIVKYSEELPK